MTAKRLLIRIAVALGLIVGFYVFLAAIDLDAAPIRPDIRKLVSQPQESTAKFMPARAGWDGPEMPRDRDAQLNAALDPAVAQRANRAALVTAATPDARAVLGIIGIIFLLRLLKSYEDKNAEQKQERALAPTLSTGSRNDKLAA